MLPEPRLQKFSFISKHLSITKLHLTTSSLICKVKMIQFRAILVIYSRVYLPVSSPLIPVT